jgi:hypothetical protein
MAFELTWFQLVMILEFVWILTVLYGIRETIAERIYGVRYKRWVEIDTGRMGYCILSKNLSKCTILGVKRTVARENILNNVMYFVTDNVENLKLSQADYQKWECYCNTDEFDTVYKTHLLGQFLYIFEKNYILFVLFLVILVGGIAGYGVYQGIQQNDMLLFIAQKVNETQTAVISVP